jgi:hypothetical protein
MVRRSAAPATITVVLLLPASPDVSPVIYPVNTEVLEVKDAQDDAGSSRGPTAASGQRWRAPARLHARMFVTVTAARCVAATATDVPSGAVTVIACWRLLDRSAETEARSWLR